MADDLKTDPFAAIAATLRKQKDDLDRHIRSVDESAEETNGILTKIQELRNRAERSTQVFDADSTRRR